MRRAAQRTLYTARWVLPVVAPPLLDGAVLVHGERIAAVGPAAALEPPEGCRVVDLGDAALLPGLVNVHAHPELAMFRGALEDLDFGDWILRLVGTKRAALGEVDHAAAARWTILEGLRAGMTTFGCTEWSAAAFGALREMGARGIVYREVFGPDPDEGAARLRELAAAVRTLRMDETDRVRVGVSPHAPYTVSDALYREVAAYARAESLPMALHAAESRSERDLVRAGAGAFSAGLRARGIAAEPRGTSTIELLDRLGVLRNRPLLIHCVDIDGDDVRRIAEHDCAVAHCPVANARLGHGRAPLHALLEAGVRVGIGTDSVGSNNRLDLLEEARVASLLQRAELRDPHTLPPETLLRLCTWEGARPLGVDERVGSLEPGKDADLCAVSLEGVHVRPVHDPLAALFHAARGSDVTLTVVAGEERFRDGSVPGIDAEALRSALEAAGARVRSVLPGASA
jgi:cytosine/adenosine deaminase-related metal-dependent hydrolase